MITDSVTITLVEYKGSVPQALGAKARVELSGLVGGTVGGGTGNDATASYAAIGGGSNHTASGAYSTVCGGESNQVLGAHATVGGGGGAQSATQNIVYDDYGTISGGGGNRAGSDDLDRTNAMYATVNGGSANAASGYGSTMSSWWA